jgi:hypothetical protein
MRPRDVLAVLAVAAVTAAFVVAALGPARVTAVDQVATITPAIAQPEFTTAGCVLRISTDKPAYEPGESPVLAVEASNPTDQPAEVNVWVSFLSGSPSNPLARTISLPTTIWSDKLTVQLMPGQTRTIELPTDIKLAAGQSITINVSDQQNAVMAGSVMLLNQNGSVQAAPGVRQSLRQAIEQPSQR